MAQQTGTSTDMHRYQVGPAPRRTLRTRLAQAAADYPRQFWLLFWGTLISMAGSSMIWPFLTIYVRQRLGLSLTATGSLVALNFAAGLTSVFLGGPVVDRFGRKGVMVLSLAASAVVLVAMSTVSAPQLWVALMVLNGAFGPLYRVGANAMVADLLEPGRRAAGYAMLRTIANLGIAVGPAVGGFVVAVSYGLALSVAAAASLLFALLILFFIGETAPQPGATSESARAADYGHLLGDRPFLGFCALHALATMAYAPMWILLPMYAKEHFGVPESRSGFIMSTNAAMVVLFQYAVTRVTERHRRGPVLALGSLFYALGAGSVAWGWNLPTFAVSMVVLTIGELILAPTASALTAELAPAGMRGRYMSGLGLSWQVGYVIGPLLGTLTGEHVAPAATWYGGLILGGLAAAGFAVLAPALDEPRPATDPGGAMA